MNAKRSTAIVVSSLLVLCVGPGRSLSQPATGPRTPLARLTVNVIASPVDGSAVDVASDDRDLAPGETGEITFAATDDLAGRAMGVATAAQRIPSPRHVWTIRLTLISAETGRIRVDVEMNRRTDRPEVSKRDVRHLDLTEGAAHTLDFVEAAIERPGGGQMRNIVLQLSAAMIDAPAFAREVLVYDLWLTRRDGANKEWTRHETRTALQGELVGFRFRPLRWPLGELLHSTDIDVMLQESVWGTIRGRLRADGKIEVSLTSWLELAQGPGSIGSGGGQKGFTVAPGEVVSVVLRGLSGRSAITRIDGSTTMVEYGNLFANHTAAIVLTITHLRS